MQRKQMDRIQQDSGLSSEEGASKSGVGAVFAIVAFLLVILFWVYMYFTFLHKQISAWQPR